MKRTIFFLLAILLLLSGCKDKKEDVKEETPTSNTKTIKENKIVLKELTIETGSKVPSIEEFLQEGTIEEFSDLRFENTDPDCVEDKKTECSVMIKDKNLAATGEYKVIVTINGEEYVTKLIVKDTTAPEVKTKDVTITEGDKIDITSFIDTCTDNSNAKCSYKLVNNENKEVNLKNLKKGEHKLTIVVSDKSDNETKKEVKLVVNEKKKEPNKNENTQKPTTPTKPVVQEDNNDDEPSNDKPAINTDVPQKIESNITDKKIVQYSVIPERHTEPPEGIKLPNYNGELWYAPTNPIEINTVGIAAFYNWNNTRQKNAKDDALNIAKIAIGTNDYCVENTETIYAKNAAGHVVGIILKISAGRYDSAQSCSVDKRIVYANTRKNLSLYVKGMTPYFE